MRGSCNAGRVFAVAFNGVIDVPSSPSEVLVMSQLRLSLALLSIAALPAAAQVRSAGTPAAAAASPAALKRAPAGKVAGGYTIDQFLSPSSPLEVSAAKKADKVAWVSYEKGMRNVYVASAPDFKAVRVTKFLDDDGVDVGSVRIS